MQITNTGENKLAGRTRKGWGQFQERGVLIVLIGICIIFSIITPNFRHLTNIINITRQIAEIAIAGIGMTYVIIAAEIDLSVGSTYGLTAITSAIILRQGLPVILAFIGPMVVGGLIGLFNGVVSTKLRVPAFITTLSVLALARGAIYGLSGGYSISIFPKSVNSFFLIGSSIGDVFPVQIIIMLALFVIAGIVLSKTTLGFQIYATGGNKKAAQLTGINTDRIKIYAFIICGVTSAIAGIISLGYLQSVHPSAGIGREMDVVAAVILGGTFLYGGRGTILGTFIGAAIIGVVRNGMVLLGVPAYSQEAFIGFVILVAVIADIWLRREK
ncbi:MAG: ABC transporter permease [Actinobacteria bacterium]|nr:ABC transporter permease [Actinomycetota bacterium]